MSEATFDEVMERIVAVLLDAKRAGMDITIEGGGGGERGLRRFLCGVTHDPRKPTHEDVARSLGLAP